MPLCSRSAILKTLKEWFAKSRARSVIRYVELALLALLRFNGEYGSRAARITHGILLRFGESEGVRVGPPSARQVALRMPADRWKATGSQLQLEEGRQEPIAEHRYVLVPG